MGFIFKFKQKRWFGTAFVMLKSLKLKKLQFNGGKMHKEEMQFLKSTILHEFREKTGAFFIHYSITGIPLRFIKAGKGREG